MSNKAGRDVLTLDRLLIAVVVAFCSGCIGPTIQPDSDPAIVPRRLGAQVLGDVLSINGEMAFYAYTDFGVKLIECADDTGRQLRLRSAQIFWMKVECFELELDAPAEIAQSVLVHLKFTSRAGVEEIRQTLPIDRSGHPSFHNASHRWNRVPDESRQSDAKGKQ